MILYGSNNVDKFYNKQILNANNKILNKEYDFYNIRLQIRYDYNCKNNFYNEDNIFCIYIGQPYYNNDKIYASQLLKLFKKSNYLLFNRLKGSFFLIIYDFKKNELIIYRFILFMDSIFYSTKNKREFEFSNHLGKLEIIIVYQENM